VRQQEGKKRWLTELKATELNRERQRKQNLEEEEEEGVPAGSADGA